MEQPPIEEEIEDEEDKFNPEDLPDQNKFNWFKYLLDTELNEYDEDGKKSVIHSADSYNILLNLLTSSDPPE